jgi:hypothetical protein
MYTSPPCVNRVHVEVGVKGRRVGPCFGVADAHAVTAVYDGVECGPVGGSNRANARPQALTVGSKQGVGKFPVGKA